MPPKKAAAAAAAAAANGEGGEGNGRFQWEGANDTKLLLLTQGRYVKPEEYEQLSSAIPGTTLGSIRNRISALRVKQRNLYEALQWPLPEGGATKKPKTAGVKRGAEAVDEGTPSKKKGRAKKVKTDEEVLSEEEGEGGGEADGKPEGFVKKEVCEEEA